MTPSFLKDLSFVKRATFIQSIIIVCLLGILGAYFLKMKTLEEQSKFLKLNTENLIIFTEDKGRILALERSLSSDKAINKALGDNLARVAYKILSLSEKYKDDGITPSLLLGLIYTESRFNPNIISKASDGVTPVSYGLMQITRETGTFLLEKEGFTWSPETILSTDINLEMGTKYLVTLHRQFVSMGIELPNEYTMSLVAYNRGSRSIIEAYNGRNKGVIVMSYYMKVRTASKRWMDEGF
jgi:soluble lytic murein transglycosylase-like protein